MATTVAPITIRIRRAKAPEVPAGYSWNAYDDLMEDMATELINIFNNNDCKSVSMDIPEDLMEMFSTLQKYQNYEDKHCDVFRPWHYMVEQTMREDYDNITFDCDFDNNRLVIYENDEEDSEDEDE